jgi:hypothetical protein
MRAAISVVVEDYDFILLDCPPSLSLLTLNGLCAADSVLIPMQCEYYALEGLSDLVQTIRKVRTHLNPRLEIEGLLRTMYDPRNTLALNVSADLQKHFGEKLYRTVIPRNIRLAEAPSHGVPVLQLDKTSKGALAYLALAGECCGERECGLFRREGTVWLLIPGRGLDALLAGSDEISAGERCSLFRRSHRRRKVSPRTRMDEDSLAELALSIKAQGVQPISCDRSTADATVSPRTTLAAQRLKEVPAPVRSVPIRPRCPGADRNIQREDQPAGGGAGNRAPDREFD